MAKKNKFKPGKTVETIVELATLIQFHHWIYLYGRPKHPLFIYNMSLNTLTSYIRRGQLRRAELNKEESP